MNEDKPRNNSPRKRLALKVEAVRYAAEELEYETGDTQYDSDDGIVESLLALELSANQEEQREKRKELEKGRADLLSTYRFTLSNSTPAQLRREAMVVSPTDVTQLPTSPTNK